jgi:hypothetical protein
VLRNVDLDDAFDRLCVLEDPARRAAYLTVRGAARPLSRGEVAAATGLAGRLAGVHLEKLVAAGYLEAGSPAAPSGRAGHPAKRSRPSDLTLEVAVPPRRYDLAAEILVAAWPAPDPPPRTRPSAAPSPGPGAGPPVARDSPGGASSRRRWPGAPGRSRTRRASGHRRAPLRGAGGVAGVPAAAEGAAAVRPGPRA